ncbi:hypothetical protein HJFPF1_09539 [Paramyrothecium foliicola]|nr:hypothetical protein HJFPF1_09539 [Paramyrothecium foliicola]
MKVAATVATLFSASLGLAGVITPRQCNTSLCPAKCAQSNLIALEYTHSHREDLYHVLWVLSKTDPELAENYGAIARKVIHPKELMWDSTDQQRNIKEAKDWLSSTSSILITKQLMNVESAGSGYLRVDGLSVNDGASLLSSIVSSSATDDERHLRRPNQSNNDEKARKVSTHFGSLPCAIAQIGGNQKHKTASLGMLPCLITKTLANVFNVALGALEPYMRILLGIIAFLGSENIWENIFFRKHLRPTPQFFRNDEEKVTMIRLRTELINRFLLTHVGFDPPHETSSFFNHRSLKEICFTSSLRKMPRLSIRQSLIRHTTQ